ncbi:Dfp1/Him1, central region-domain-containing protein [Pyronema domesticum]|nr:Dfp1/Him1, central region-domain-containing protein [Pyronema domesticum]
MAQVSFPPSPAGASRRTPLSNLPNAVNSNFSTTMSGSIKRSRSGQRDTSNGQPPTKKQAIDAAGAHIRTPVRRSQPTTEPAKAAQQPKRASTRTRTATGNPPLFQELQPTREQKTTGTKTEQPERVTDDVLAWQKHFRRAFPGFVFFFENISPEVSARAQKQVVKLGATYEKFFSSNVTHLITNRLPNSDATTAIRMSRAGAGATRKAAGNTDILLKAKEYGMKIWTTEKLERVLNVLFDFSTTRSTLSATHTRDQPARAERATTQQNDLTHLLRNERLHGPTDRDPTVASKDLHYWKGPYIYIHDMLGANRPIILREYPKVQRREEGTWPQFRSVSGGKCPFIEESVHQEREKHRNVAAQKAKKAEATVDKAVAPADPKAEAKAEIKPRRKEASAIPARTATAPTTLEPPKAAVKEAATTKDRSPAKSRTSAGKNKRALTELDTAANARPAVTAETELIKKRSGRNENNIAFTATNETASAGVSQRSNVEPAASGMQPSNITSAIHSRMISSHQDQPGQRAGTSKEIQALHRRVAGNVLLNNNTSNAAAKRVPEFFAKPSDPEPKNTRKTRAAGPEMNAKTGVVETKKEKTVRLKPEPKPGYCENCREKFDDFEEHTFSRQHRRFAANSKNWSDLDTVICLLTRIPRAPSPREYH